MASRTSRKRAATKVESIRHKDKRANIPTEELRDFVAQEEETPKTLLYPRDPSLDPQLVWKGKDDQDRHDLAVTIVPIYIQEKIHPQAIINAPDSTMTGLRDRAMLHLTIATGIRVSELVGIQLEDLVLQPQPTLTVHGKGRRERRLPLWRETATALKRWLRARRSWRLRPRR